MVYTSCRSSWQAKSACAAAVVFISLFLLAELTNYSHAQPSCKQDEVPSSESPCTQETTCNACKVCSPCMCKEDFIRTRPGGECISQNECHDLHLQWLAAAKYEGKKNTFFNCDG